MDPPLEYIITINVRHRRGVSPPLLPSTAAALLAIGVCQGSASTRYR